MRHRYKGALCAVILGLLAGIASAATVTVTGTNPTQNTDDTSIAATGPGSLVTLRFEYGTCSAPNVFGTKAGEVTRAAGAPGANFSQVFNLNPGTTCVRVFVNNTYGNESVPSNVTSRTVDAPTPKPPILATVPLTINVPLSSGDGFTRTVAYKITTDGPGVLAGFTKVGTPTLEEPPVFTYRGQTYCRFLLNHPRTGAPNVAWDKGVQPTQNVASPCS